MFIVAEGLVCCSYSFCFGLIWVVSCGFNLSYCLLCYGFLWLMLFDCGFVLLLLLV